MKGYNQMKVGPWSFSVSMTIVPTFFFVKNHYCHPWPLKDLGTTVVYMFLLF